MEVAETWSLRSTCTRGKAGCVIATIDGHILSTGFNGAPRGLPHCTEVGCLVESGHCVRTVHAEMNAVIQAARVGAQLTQSVVYTTRRPCVRCALALIQVGVKEVIYQEEYLSDSVFVVEEFFKTAKITMRKVESHA